MSDHVMVVMSGETKRDCPVLVREAFRDPRSKLLLVVEAIRARHTREDTGSLGGNPWDEWLFELTCRLATDTEAQTVLEREASDRGFLQRERDNARQEMERLGRERAEGERAKPVMRDAVRGLYCSGYTWAGSVLDSTEYPCDTCNASGRIMDVEQEKPCFQCDGTGRTSIWGASSRKAARDALVAHVPGDHYWSSLYRCRFHDGSTGYFWTCGTAVMVYGSIEVITGALRRHLEQKPLTNSPESIREWADRKFSEQPLYRLAAGLDLLPEE